MFPLTHSRGCRNAFVRLYLPAGFQTANIRTKRYDNIKKEGGGIYLAPSVEILEISTLQSVCALSYNKDYNYNDPGKTGYIWYDRGNDDIDF